jgi:hypothetical protein
MIRLNDINKTVIDEKSINEYYSQGEMGLNTIRMIIGGTYENFMYSTKELRDKDIELLDKLLDVKSIEDKANEEYDFGELQVINPKPTKEEKYITWEEVKNSKKNINIKLSNGDIHSVGYDEGNARIQFFVGYNGYDYEGCIYEEDLFNALMLKKVE